MRSPSGILFSSLRRSRAGLERLVAMLVVAAVAAAAGEALSQTRTPAGNASEIAIVVERNEGAAWKQIDSRLVLNANDRVRFKIRTNFDGFLYVTNLGTSGQYSVLFPGAETGRQNKIEAGKEYLVPATQTAFRIAGPAGHDVVYWLVSPVEIKMGDSPASPSDPPKPLRLVPRCDETMLQVKGECLDTSSGPKQIPEASPVPGDMARVPSLRSRDLMFITKEDTTIVASPAALRGPVIYEFRLSHR